MFKPIDRRTVLRASGIAIALPLLESMQPVIASSTAIAPKRLVTICSTLGFYSSSWFPKQSGANYEASEYLQIIDRHRDNYTVFSGLSHEEQTGRQPHNSETTWLTAARRPGLDGFRNTISLDQVAANHFGYVTRFPSIVLGTATPQSQSYTRSGAMMPAQTSPSRLFAKLFLQGTDAEIEKQARNLAEGQSILDRIGTQSQSLKSKLSSHDKHKVDAYLEAVRATEIELNQIKAWQARPKPNPNAEAPEDIPNASDLLGRVKSMLRMIPLILQTDSSRSISMMIQDHGVVLQMDGVTSDQHNLSHHGQDDSKIAQLKIIETSIIAAFGNLLSELSDSDEYGSSLLNQSVLILGSNLGNANAHTTTDLPILLAGGGFDHGKHIACETNTPLSNLFVSCLSQIGVPSQQFGQSTGILTV
jgi:hypothetical protein